MNKYLAFILLIIAATNTLAWKPIENELRYPFYLTIKNSIGVSNAALVINQHTALTLATSIVTLIRPIRYTEGEVCANNSTVCIDYDASDIRLLSENITYMNENNVGVIRLKHDFIAMPAIKFIRLYESWVPHIVGSKLIALSNRKSKTILYTSAVISGPSDKPNHQLIESENAFLNDVDYSAPIIFDRETDDYLFGLFLEQIPGNALSYVLDVKYYSHFIHDNAHR